MQTISSTLIWNSSIKEQSTHLIAVGKVHFEPMSIYAGTVKDLKDIPAGTKVGIPNDATNGGRALLLLGSKWSD